VAYTTDRTWVAGEVVTAAYFNAHLRDNMKWLSTDKPMFSGYRNTTQSLTTAIAATIQMNAENFDNSTIHDTASSNTRMTVPSGAAGKWLFGCQVEFAANATGQRAVALVTDGTNYLAVHAQDACASGVTQMMGIALAPIGGAQLAAASYGEAEFTQSSGGNLNIGGGGTYQGGAWALWVGI
jgi:hypothetical protein